MATLMLMSRDTYPHDQIPDIHDINAVKPFDAKAAKSPELATMFEDGVTSLDAKAHAAHGVAYLQVLDESERKVILEASRSSSSKPARTAASSHPVLAATRP